MRITVLSFLLFISTATIAQVQPVSASINRDSILIGEKVQLVFKAFFPKGQSVDWFTVDTIPHFEIMERSKVDSQEYQGSLVVTQTYTLTSWDSGEWVIPSFVIPLGSTQPLNIAVKWSSPFDPKQPYHDIKDIVGVEEPGASSWYWWLIGAVILLLLLLFIFRKRKKPAEPVEVLDKGAYRRAIEDLDKVSTSGIAEKDVKGYYTQMINIFRQYLQAGKGIRSFSRTTDDLSIQIKQLDMRNDEYNRLVQVLRMSDLVKFANYRPSSPDDKDALVTLRKSIIEIENPDAV